jgi:hypothetical protein
MKIERIRNEWTLEASRRRQVESNADGVWRALLPAKSIPGADFQPFFFRLFFFRPPPLERSFFSDIFFPGAFAAIIAYDC